tara:strand:+ start:963 stop:1067 length:105 start_codon:yes stop_codon:yes gene_type:complete
MDIGGASSQGSFVQFFATDFNHKQQELYQVELRK